MPSGKPLHLPDDARMVPLARTARTAGALAVLLTMVGCSGVLNPISPEEAHRRVVEVVRQIVNDLGNEVAEAKFGYEPCGMNGKPPFKGHAHIGLWMPGADRAREVSSESVTHRLQQHGWETNPDYHTHAQAFTRNGQDITVWVIPPPKPGKSPNSHVMIDVYGPCRDTFDHRSDGTAFSSTDIRDELASR